MFQNYHTSADSVTMTVQPQLYCWCLMAQNTTRTALQAHLGMCKAADDEAGLDSLVSHLVSQLSQYFVPLMLAWHRYEVWGSIGLTGWDSTDDSCIAVGMQVQDKPVLSC